MEPDVKLAEALDKCLAAIKEGKSVDVCLAENPENCARIKSLLYTGSYIASLPKVQPSEDFRRTAKGRLMARIREEESSKKHVYDEAGRVAPAFDSFSTTMRQFWQTVAGARRVALPVALSLLLIIGAALGALSFMSPTPALADACTLSVLGGSVEVLGPDSEVRTGVDGMTLEPGMRVRTSDGSSALLTFFDGSTVTMDAGTDVEIQKLESNSKESVTVVLKQWVGRTWSNVANMADSGSRFQINTPSAAALIRSERSLTNQGEGAQFAIGAQYAFGARFSLEVDESGGTREQTMHGMVTVAAQGEEVTVHAGKGTMVKYGAAPSEPEDALVSEEQPQEQGNHQAGGPQSNMSMASSESNEDTDVGDESNAGGNQGQGEGSPGHSQGNADDNTGDGQDDANNNNDTVDIAGDSEDKGKNSGQDTGNDNKPNGNNSQVTGNDNQGGGGNSAGQGNSGGNAGNGNGNANNGQANGGTGNSGTGNSGTGNSGQGNGNSGDNPGNGNNNGNGNDNGNNGQSNGNGGDNANNGNSNSSANDYNGQPNNVNGQDNNGQGNGNGGDNPGNGNDNGNGNNGNGNDKDK